MVSPSWLLLVQTQQWKHRNNVQNLLKVNNKDSKLTSYGKFLLILNKFQTL